MWLRNLLTLLCLAAASSQDYQEYEYANDGYQQYQDGYQQHDTMYEDYVDRKAAPAGGGWGRTFTVGAASWFLGAKFHSRRSVKKAQKAAEAKLKDQIRQYYEIIAALQQENEELRVYANDVARQQKESEFQAADYDHDDKVSRVEFLRYKKAYLQKHPEMAGLFPDFEDFDPDSNGYISKSEYDAYYRKMGL